MRKSDLTPRDAADVAEPVPEDLVEGLEGKELELRKRGFRALHRMMHQEEFRKSLSTMEEDDGNTGGEKPYRRSAIHFSPRSSKDVFERQKQRRKIPSTTIRIPPLLKSKEGPIPKRHKKHSYDDTNNLAGEVMGSLSLPRVYNVPMDELFSPRSIENIPEHIKPLLKAVLQTQHDSPVHFDSSFLPLELFDDMEGECHPPEEWEAMCKHSIYARSQYYHPTTGTSWHPCKVLGFDPVDETFEIEWENGKRKQVKRLNIIFDNEDQEVLFSRIKRAEERRAEAEAEIRYYIYVDKLPGSEIRPLSDEIIESILKRTGIPLDSINYDEFIDEISTQYMRGVKLSIFDVLCSTYDLKDKIPLIKPPFPSLQNENSAPDYGLLPVEKELTLQNAIDLIQNALTIGDGTIVQFIFDLMHRWSQMKKGLFTLDPHLFPCSIQYFLVSQKDTIHEVMLNLEGQWIPSICTNVQNDLEHHIDLFVNNYKSFSESKERKFLCLLNFLMSQFLRTILSDSVQELVSFLSLYLKKGVMDKINPGPLLKAAIVIDSGEIVLNPTLEETKDVLAEIAQTAIDRICSLCSIGEKLFPLIKIPSSTLVPLHHTGWVLLKVEKLIEELFEDNKKGPMKLLKKYKRYKPLLDVNHTSFVKDFMESNPSNGDFEEQLKRVTESLYDIQIASADRVVFNLFTIDCIGIKTRLAEQSKAIRSEILQHLIRIISSECSQLKELFQDIYSKLTVEPETPEDLDALQQYVENCGAELKDLILRFEDVHEKRKILRRFNANLDDEDFSLYWQVWRWPKQLKIVLQGITSNIDAQRKNFMQQLKKSVGNLSGEIRLYAKEIEKLGNYGDMEEAEQMHSLVQEIKDKLDHFKDQAKLYNFREKLFKWPQTSFPELKQIVNKFEPYFNLWTITWQMLEKHPEWLNGPFIHLDPEGIEETTSSWYKTLGRLIKILRKSAPKSVAHEIKSKLESFKVHKNLIRALRNPGLRPRHWKKISEIVGTELKPSEHLTLNGLIDMDLESHMKQIQEVSDYAAKEHGLENKLMEMRNQWKETKFELGISRDGSTHILKDMDTILDLLDDHIVTTQTMRGSQFVKALETDVITWERSLLNVQDMVDEWMKCQRSWMYLSPVFSSQDIARQMPNEAKAFEKVDKLWRSVMETVARNPSVLQVSTLQNITRNFKEANGTLDHIQKNLSQYLETKRLAFPRFFFLSDEELLSILSESKEPTRIQPHLRKCFEGIKELDFTEKLTILAMRGKDGEKIRFLDVIDPFADGGQVELWIKKVEQQMKFSVRDQVAQAISDYTNLPRSEWILKWPGQIVLSVSQLFWTMEVEKAIEAQGYRGLKKHLKKLNKQMNDLIMLVRGELGNRERTTLGALVVIDVHARDVVEHMVEAHVDHVDDFEWLSQLRYYWDENEGSTKKDLWVKQINATLKYGYEYLGNSGRLVITPLTDRCYRTLMSALHLNRGGAPEGPAGTGKTETVKDLAKAVAKQCVVFNCSDGLDYLAMNKFFKGLAASGAWSCFDEFNRIDLEVLSVVAQQILSIQRAVGSKSNSVIMEDQEVTLNPTCAVFITMNPGYAGRSELPDNLKALFRPVAMMVPDYALIAEIILFSFGFIDGRNLARKIVATYRLCSEQLSSQDHYDYGMRAVKAVLTAAGRLKQENMKEKEDILMLRALTEVNLPKFIASDIPLFKGIISDLFPGIELPERNYEYLNKALLECCSQLLLQPTKPFLEKCLQLYEMIIVRHGLMIVGHPFSGKTSAHKVLSGALRILSKSDRERNVRSHIINPKSVTLGQLYGEYDEISRDWNDGILSKTFRVCAGDTSEDRHWIIFDGPVDAVWIESMNTVLDDNKKLCLVSGEMIPMSNLMNLIFEVQDLAVASPATVSRCGMVYMDPQDLGWKPLVESWMEQTLPSGIKEKPASKKHLRRFIDWLVPVALKFIRKHCQEPVATMDTMLVRSFLDMFESLSDGLRDEESVHLMSQNELNKRIECIGLFSLVWSIGGSLDEPSRKSFDEFVRKTVSQKKAPLSLSLPMPKEGDVYSYYFDHEFGKWNPWTDNIKNFAVPNEAQFHEIIVPTIDTERYSFLLRALMYHNKRVLFVGPTGTGKTVYIKQVLNNLDREKFSPIFINFSAQTNANQTQDMIEAKLEKRKRGTLGPSVGKQAVMFVDDLNMPALEVYGAQPPIELLRQWADHGGWYDRKEGEFTNIVDTQMVAAMGIPGGGRNPITTRLLRHFNMIHLCSFDEKTLYHIFSTILQWYLKSSQMSDLVKPIVQATILLYHHISQQMLPIPAKPHYLFNLRDLSKVFQGIMTKPANSLENKTMMLRLWYHECQRVFSDRLVEEQDYAWFRSKMQGLLRTRLQTEEDKILPDENPLIFGSFSQDDEDSEYTQFTDITQLTTHLNDCLEEHNRENPKQQMSLVLFEFAIGHLSRIHRIINLPFGNALLIGVGGSGRQSLTRLAAHMSGFDYFTIELNRSYGLELWREDMRSLLKKVGLEAVPTVFVLTDSQIKEESFLEDINNILNTGEIPNLFDDEIVEIEDYLRPKCEELEWQDKSRNGIYNLFVKRCQENLHIVLCMSPVGDFLRNSLRKFPSLVSCTTIDWFSEWPSDALESVAARFLGDIEIEPDESTNLEAVKDSIVKACVYFHDSTRNLCDKFSKELQRKTYVTPTSFLELISTYSTILKEKRTEIRQSKTRYDNGLSRLEETEIQVEELSEQMKVMQPKIKETTQQTAELIKQIEKDSLEAEKKREIIKKEKVAADTQAKEAKEIKESCETELAKVMPALEAANKALKRLKREEVNEVRALGQPPKGVKLVMKVVCMLKGIPPDRKNDGLGKKIEDYWDPAKRMMADTHFLEGLQSFDKDGLTDKIINGIQSEIKKKEFQPAEVKKANKAAEGLARWVLAIDKYYHANKEVLPRKEALKKAEASYNATMEELRKKEQEMEQIENRLTEMRNTLQESEDKKAMLEAQYEEMGKKMDRAQRLMSGLGGEKIRWRQASDSLALQLKNLTGDVLVAAGILSYLGAFTNAFRQDIIQDWCTLCRETNIPLSDNFNFETKLGDPIVLKEWTLCGLPSDSFSRDNSIIMKHSRRWPLFIDPQGQANKWIKQMEIDNHLKVIKLTDDNFLRSIENAVQFGFPILIENVGEELDPALEPLLLQQTFSQGGVLSIKLGDTIIDYNDKFYLYMTTKLRNPHYLPELSTKVNLINFMITQEGLQDQLLGIVVQREEQDLEKQKNEIVQQRAQNEKRLKSIEDQILELIEIGGEHLLEDDKVIDTLAVSKQTSDEISREQDRAKDTEEKIDQTRNSYSPAAFTAASLFFCISELANIAPMYQYSLNWYIGLFKRSIDLSEKAEDISQRIQNLTDHFMVLLYQNVCRSLFEKDKLLFSFSVALKMLETSQQLYPEELSFLLNGGIIIGDKKQQNPCDWLPDKVWNQVVALSTEVQNLSKLKQSVAQNALWKIVYESNMPHEEKLPDPWHNNVSDFQRLLLIRALRPDKVIPATQHFISKRLGPTFIDPPPFDLEGPYTDSNCITPLIFVLSPGVDPMDQLIKFGEKHGSKMESLSLGQGQGKKAEALIKEGILRGNWVVLQNCHLAPSWMPTLEKIVNEMTHDQTHLDFRLWLTSMPSRHFPVTILQNGIKMTNEPPRGLRTNLLKSYNSDPINDDEFYTNCASPNKWHKLLFGLCFFHAVVQERRTFGSLGWNIPYEFNDSDLLISMQQLQMFLNEYEKVPFKALTYLAGQANYGGRVTDERDRRTLLTLLSTYYTPKIFDSKYTFSPSGIYHAPAGSKREVIQYIKGLPLNPDPEVFGLHQNAEITKALKESFQLLEAVRLTMPREISASGKSTESVIDEITEKILQQLPQDFHISQAQEKYPVTYGESMNTVLIQELFRYNKLLAVVRSSLRNLKRAVKGEVVMSAELEQLSNSITAGKIPDMWMMHSYPSLKPLSAYIADLTRRIQFFNDWILEGPPTIFWISGFFFTQSFLTGVLQNFARKYKIPIDTLTFEFKILKKAPSRPPQDGCFINGMFLEGARWDHQHGCLAESEAKELFANAPILWLKPVEDSKAQHPSHYDCPLYKTSARRGTLSTTGHSTNFILNVKLPAHDPDHWVKRGTALLCQLDD